MRHHKNVRYVWTCTCGAGLDPSGWRENIHWLGTVATATCWSCESFGIRYICLRDETGKPRGVVRLRNAATLGPTND